MRVIVAAGGTGGHLFPGIAVAHELKEIKSDVEILFMVTGKPIDREIMSKEEFNFCILPVKGFVGKTIRERGMLPFYVGISFLKFLFIFLRKKPGVILGTGGYAAFVPLLVGIIFGVPTVLSEQDSYPGVTTRLLCRYVTEVHLAHRKAKKYLSAGNIYITGNPVRKFVFRGSRKKAMDYFSLKENKKTIFIMGGSQGAHSINRVFVDIFNNHNFPELQFIFQTGENDFHWVKESLTTDKENVKVFSFIERMDLAYVVTDLMFCRAGALTLAEIASSGIASVLIPFPFAAGGHQEENARFFEKKGAAILVLDSELESERVVGLIKALIDDETRLESMRKNALSLSQKEAAREIAVRILELAGEVTDVS
jgi:UDP-N-acetylglucosamine--N-acetylmuramyl-(pentapeptide) pyrophosphoryl-undecaprenol N-acetylglucosamine transferase